MHIVALAWIFVVLLMVAAEAGSTQGTLLGAFFTLLLYGALPLSIVMYLLGTPGRRRARRQRDAAAAASATAVDAPANPVEPGTSAAQGDGGGHAAGAPVAPERKEP